MDIHSDLLIHAHNYALLLFISCMFNIHNLCHNKSRSGLERLEGKINKKNKAL